MLNELPLVSVIIPAYDNAPFIKFALESLFQQTYPQEKIEIIVIDDGSTDNTNEILNEYRKKIIYVHQENKGVASARNRGMSLAKGEVIIFLDADDMWHEEKIQKVIDKFRDKQNIGMVYHPIELIDT
ncbi:MAG: glycosyltransferase family 2 protein [Nitrospira sp.]|nr:glycosyltransferase family 2 protein [Nitrospira sp.]